MNDLALDDRCMNVISIVDYYVNLQSTHMIMYHDYLSLTHMNMIVQSNNNKIFLYVDVKSVLSYMKKENKRKVDTDLWKRVVFVV